MASQARSRAALLASSSLDEPDNRVLSHAEKIVDRTAKDIGVEKQSVYEAGKIKGWMWSLPDKEPTSPQIASKE